jgi:hypothetical protein
MNREKLIERLFALNSSSTLNGYWTTKNGEKIPIEKLTDFHLQNIVNHCQKIMDARMEALRQPRYVEKDSYNGVFSMGEDPCDDSMF